MSEYEVPDFGEGQDNISPTPEDWDEEPRYKSPKNEYDVHSRILEPSTKSAYNIGKGVDPSSGKFRTGFVPSGFTEANTVDLTSANLIVDSIPKNLDERLIMACNTCLANLKNMYEITGIDVRPAYNLILLKRDLYNSMTKARNGKLMEYAFVKKSDIVQTRTDIARQQTPKKKSFKDKIFGSTKNDGDNWE